MAHDESNASYTEDWVISQIGLLAEGEGPAIFEQSDVQPFDGTTAGDLNTLAQELFSGVRDRVVRVLHHDDYAREQEEGKIDVIPRYVILVGIKNRRPQAARRGDGTWIGTNRLTELLRYALHDQVPMHGNPAEIINDGTNAVDRIVWRKSELILNRHDQCILQVTIEAHETEYAGA